TVFRFNFSHGNAQIHTENADKVREASKKVGREVAIMADLQGPKIRVGKFVQGQVQLNEGQIFTLQTLRQELGDEQAVGLDYKDLAHDVRVGDTLLLDDGLIALEVKQILDLDIVTEVQVGGILSNNKGINKKGGGLTAPALTAKDVEDIKVASQLGADYIAVSFPKDATDMKIARQFIQMACLSRQTTPALIAKIERVEAVKNIAEILDNSEGIMVARGDLAVEVGNAAVPAIQKELIRQALSADKFVITATQMMESMITHPIPTRAEVSDVANAVLDGTDAVMLSAETATGKYPLETVQQMAQICVEAEKAAKFDLNADFNNLKLQRRIDHAIALGGLFTAYHLGAKALVALTESGATALWMSRYHIKIPIYALTTKLQTQRKMALYYNVRSVLMESYIERDVALQQAEKELLRRGIVELGDVYAITCGEPMGAPGGTNMLKISRVSQRS
ncbi:MAG: pyruvate kinase, partial [Gammaproteobacteria bacterium]|nr:pyruvate kinase [Gammaproteobacteria bacterium]